MTPILKRTTEERIRNNTEESVSVTIDNRAWIAPYSEIENAIDDALGALGLVFHIPEGTQ